MGSGSSKPTNGQPTSHVWTSETPVKFSQELIDSLQTSTETDSTRAKTLELHIQSRVNSELQKLRDETSHKLAELEAAISSQQESKAKEGSTKSAGDALRDLGREAVENDVLELKKKLAQRKMVKDSDAGVDEAKDKLVNCLRVNDRRPLDCWKEVETFKNEVRRLEGQWVEKVVR
ncbi:hypothetical protein BP6252_04852 [Coleophoma cylindrospora]|uniref:Altered inheritance of mitochondria protein 13, mitochondrial n=1 Tax=Coleophoma cylindrospora TaxID=1849047 RepID=A0A3D8S2A6_9HELO|nr:hypothetical protein BP6252_04852 [Coleophoma cylindrospora]